MKGKYNMTDIISIKYSMFGITSILLGIFNLIITFLIFWALYTHIYGFMGTKVIMFGKILDIGSNIELFTKPIGLLLGIIGLFQKKSSRKGAIWGFVINLVTILWTIALILGFII